MVRFVVGQPAHGALPLAVAQHEGALIGYLPGLSMRGLADLHAGGAETDTLMRRSSRSGPDAVACALDENLGSPLPQ
jgi:hypothetical protein